MTIVRLLDRRTRLALPALILAASVFAAVALSHPGDAGAAKATSLGKTKRTPKPSCPGADCEAVGRVTGFQQRADGKKGLFKVPAGGHIVAWSVKLSKPDKEQRAFFSEFYRDSAFGSAPSARLAILKPKGDAKFKLKKQSPVVDLRSDLDTSPLLTLKRPLRVKRGDIVALTMPTWLPNFAVELSRENSWRASRSPKKCTGEADIKDSRPHMDVGKTRRYGCTYSTARLLYWAYFVRSDGGGKDGDGKDGDGKDGGGRN